MSVDTNTKGKNLTPYQHHRLDGLEILVPRNLAMLAQSMRIDVSGGLRKKLAVEFSDGSDAACAL